MRGSVLISGALASACAPASFSGDGASYLDAVIKFGQSNEKGNFAGNIPAGIPSSDVLYWLVSIGSEEYSGFGPLDAATDDTHGSELSLGLAMVADQRQAAIIKVTKGATGLDEWLPGTTYGDRLLSTVTDAKAALAADYPQFTVRWSLIVYQGENEAIAATQAAALLWKSRFLTVQAGLEDIVGPLDPIVTRIHSGVAGSWTSTVRAQQEATTSRIANVDDLLLAGGLHITAGAQNTLGGRQNALLPWPAP